MDVFLQNLLRALGIVAGTLSAISFTINQSTVRLLDIVIYSGIVSIVMSFINSASYSGAFTLSKISKDKVSRSRDNFDKG